MQLPSARRRTPRRRSGILAVLAVAGRRPGHRDGRRARPGSTLRRAGGEPGRVRELQAGQPGERVGHLRLPAARRSRASPPTSASTRAARSASRSTPPPRRTASTSTGWATTTVTAPAGSPRSLPTVLRQPAQLHHASPRPGSSTAATGPRTRHGRCPPTAVSGIYFAHLVRTDGTAGESHVFFVVRDDDGGSDMLFQTSDTTWQAYNTYGGNSLYTGSPAGRAYKVSYNRPFTTRANAPEDWVFNAEYPMVRFLESNGYDVSYTTGVDTHRRGGELHRARDVPVGRPRRVLVGYPARQRRGGAGGRASTWRSSAATRCSGRRGGRTASTARARPTGRW